MNKDLIIVGGGVVSALNIFDGTSKIRTDTGSEAELNFMLRKIDWALSGGTVLEPTGGFPSSPLDELRVEKDGTIYTFSLNDDNNFTISSNSQTHQLTDTLVIDDLVFSSFSGTSDKVLVDITIDGETLNTITRYVRTD